MKVSKQELEAVTALSPEKRYNYFVKRICDWEQVWGLFEDDCIVLNEAKNGKLYVLLFPFEDFASHYATNTKGMTKQPHIGVLIYTNSLKQSEKVAGKQR